MDWHDFSPGNPFRPPSWRWQRAGAVVGGQMPLSRRRDDPWSARAARFRSRLDAAGHDQYRLLLLSEKEPGPFWARRVWEPGGPVEPRNVLMMRRYELEARVLADQPPDRIAARCGLDPGTVEAYEKLFFDVRPRLDQVGYIAQQVIGTAIHQGVTSREFDLLWKLAAYMRGTAYLEMLMTTYVGGRRDVPAAELRGVGAQDSMDDLMRQSLIAGKTFRLTTESQTEVIALYQKCRDSERLAGTAGGGEDSIMLNLEGLLKMSRVTVGAPVAGESPIPGYDDGAVEMTGDQLVDASFGRPVSADAEIMSLSFPQRKLTAGGTS